MRSGHETTLKLNYLCNIALFHVFHLLHSLQRITLNVLFEVHCQWALHGPMLSSTQESCILVTTNWDGNLELQ